MSERDESLTRRFWRTSAPAPRRCSTRSGASTSAARSRPRVDGPVGPRAPPPRPVHVEEGRAPRQDRLALAAARRVARVGRDGGRRAPRDRARARLRDARPLRPRRCVEGAGPSAAGRTRRRPTTAHCPTTARRASSPDVRRAALRAPSTGRRRGPTPARTARRASFCGSTERATGRVVRSGGDAPGPSPAARYVATCPACHASVERLAARRGVSPAPPAAAATPAGASANSTSCTSGAHADALGVHGCGPRYGVRSSSPIVASTAACALQPRGDGFGAGKARSTFSPASLRRSASVQPRRSQLGEQRRVGARRPRARPPSR